MAARYQRQQYLIGPAVFPTYWFVLRLVLAWATVIYAIAKALDIAAHGLGAGAIIAAVAYLPWVLLINAAIVTLVFAAIEQASMRYPEKCAPFAPMGPAWSPAGLPPIEVDSENKPRSFAKALAEVIFGCLFLAWLLLIPYHPFLWLGPGAWYLKASPYELAAVWWTFYWCLVGLNAFELTWKVVDFVRGTWQGRKHARHLALHTLSLIPLGVLLTAPNRELFLLKNPVTDAAALGAQVSSANRGLHTAIMIVVAIVVLQLVWGVGKMGVDAYRKRVAAAQ